LLARENGDLPSFYDAVRELTKKPREERHKLLCQTPPSITEPSSDDTGQAGSAGSAR